MADYTATQHGEWNTDATWGGGGHPTGVDGADINGKNVDAVGSCSGGHV